MPDDAQFLVHAANLVAIGLLPFIFFRRAGRLNLHWWLTAAPFVLAGCALAGAAAGLQAPVILPVILPEALAAIVAIAGPLLAVGSIALIVLAAVSHPEPVSLWHQRDDAPAALTTCGAYARIRHPFYTAFLLALLGIVASHPSRLSLLALGWSAVALTLTARREERRLLASPLGGAYRAYMARTGRFFPRIQPVPA